LLLVHAEIVWSQTAEAQRSADADFHLGNRLPSPGEVRQAAHSAPLNDTSAMHNSTAGLKLRGSKFGQSRWAKTISSVCIAAGLMLGFMWLSRCMRSDTAQKVPDDLVEVVGKVALDTKHRAYLVRFGDRLLLLSLQGSGVSKLGEIPFTEWSPAPGAGQLSSPRPPHVGDTTLAQARFAHRNG
jgi:flagellar biogenesis protein FliO